MLDFIPARTSPFALLFRRENRSPVPFHVDDGPTLFPRFVQCLVELADLRLPVVGVFALGIGMMDKSHEARPNARSRPLQHFEIAIGVPEGENRPTANEAVDADRLARAVVDEFDFRKLDQCRLAVRAISNLTTPLEPTTCSGGMP